MSAAMFRKAATEQREATPSDGIEIQRNVRSEAARLMKGTVLQGKGLALYGEASALTGFAMRRKGIAPPRAGEQQPGAGRQCGGKA